MFAALSGFRKPSATSGSYNYVPYASLHTWDTSNIPATLMQAGMEIWAPVGIGYGVSKFVGGNGIAGMGGLRLNSMIPLPMVKI